MRNHPSIPGCSYCDLALNPISALKRHFGFSAFRSYGDEPLQENAVKAAIQTKSILVIFPTGGGKPITFRVEHLPPQYSTFDAAAGVTSTTSANLEKEVGISAQGNISTKITPDWSVF